MTIWAPGMRCVCVDASRTNRFDLPELVVGRVYTVSDAVTGESGLCLRLVEIPVRQLVVGDWEGWTDRPFAARRFRPLSETRLDQFRVHLNRRPVDLPIAAPLVSRPVSVRGAAVPPIPAAPRPHSLTVPAAAISAPIQVLAPIVPRVAALGRPSVAAEVFEKFELISVRPFHAHQFGLEGTHERGILTQGYGSV